MNIFRNGRFVSGVWFLNSYRISALQIKNLTQNGHFNAPMLYDSFLTYDVSFKVVPFEMKLFERCSHGVNRIKLVCIVEKRPFVTLTNGWSSQN